MKQFMSFLIVGGLNTLVGYIVFCAIKFLGASVNVALISAYVFGIGFNFFSTGKFVFGETGKEKIIKFIGVYVAAFFLNKFTLEYIDQFINSYYLSQALIMPFMAVFSFTCLKMIVFTPQKHR